MTKRAFAVAAHPDDIEFVMAGTLLHLQRSGYEIHYMNVANGCCGSTVYGRDELIRMRRLEAIEACRLVGAVFRRFGQPPVIGEVVAGLLLGPSLLGWVFPAVGQAVFAPGSLEVLKLVSQLGLVLFMFLVGIAFLWSAWRSRRESL